MLKTLKALTGIGGAHLNDDLKGILQELQGLKIEVVAGAAAGTKMNVTGLRDEDTILAAIVSTDAGGALAEDKANITIEDLRASGTITVAAVANADAVNVNGVTYTFKDEPTLATDVPRTAGDNDANAAALAAAINAYETRRTGGGYATASVVASVASAVVTVTAVEEGTGGNAYVLTSTNGTRLAVTGSGTLTGGSATGGFKSTTDLSSKSVILAYFDKQ